MKRRLPTKKVLVAAIGVATVSYALACGETTSSSGNLVAPADATPNDGASNDGANADVSSSGNLMPPPPEDASPKDTGADISSSGNLLPPPSDAGQD